MKKLIFAIAVVFAFSFSSCTDLADDDQQTIEAQQETNAFSDKDEEPDRG